jgi:hypothetical protein
VSNRLGSRNGLLGSDPGLAPQPHDPAYAQAFGSPNEYDKSSFDQPAIPQPTYVPNSYADNNMNQTWEQGYAHREGLPPTAPGPKAKENWFAFMKSRWSAGFMAVTAIQAIICLCFEAYIFATFQDSVVPDRGVPEMRSQYKTVPTFLTLFIFGFLYELAVVWDALRMKNTIQVIGVCFANLALVVYTAIQVDQLSLALMDFEIYGALEVPGSRAATWAKIRPYLIAIPAIISLTTVCMIFITWKLYQEFAWDILKNIGADYRMKKRFLHYQIYIALLKFDFFFFLGFIIQLVVIVTSVDLSDPEFALTIVTIPITIGILLAAAYFTRKEIKWGSILVIILYHGGLTYFIFKLVRIYQPDWRSYYGAVQKSLTAFAVITILLIVLTIGNAVICMLNYGNGLKAHLLSAKKEEDNPDVTSVSLRDVKPQPSRMTID